MLRSFLVSSNLRQRHFRRIGPVLHVGPAEAALLLSEIEVGRQQTANFLNSTDDGLGIESISKLKTQGNDLLATWTKIDTDTKSLVGRVSEADQAPAKQLTATLDSYTA